MMSTEAMMIILDEFEAAMSRAKKRIEALDGGASTKTRAAASPAPEDTPKPRGRPRKERGAVDAVDAGKMLSVGAHTIKRMEKRGELEPSHRKAGHGMKSFYFIEDIERARKRLNGAAA